MYILFFSLVIFALQVLLSPTIALLYSTITLTLIFFSTYLSQLIALALNSKIQLSQKKLFYCFLIGFHTGLLVIKYTIENSNRLSSESWLTKIQAIPGLAYSPLFFALFIIFFFYHLTFSKLYSLEKNLNKLFFLELFGAGLGITLGALVMDYFSWVWLMRFIYLAILGSYFYLGKTIAISLQEKVSVNIIILTLGFFSYFLEPQTSLEWSSRFAGFNRQEKIVEESRQWNTYSKVQVLSSETSNLQKKVVILSDGAGTAELVDKKLPLSVRLSNFKNFDKILLLFAGVGKELLGFKEMGLGREILKGIEINPILTKISSITYNNSLEKNLIKDDVRNYLESSNEKFDLIVFSWSGATSAYYNGAAIHTAKFSLTREAFEKAFDRLSSNGVMLILGVSKVNVMSSLKQIHRGLENILLVEHDFDSVYHSGWDRNLLYVKKSPWEKNELQALNKIFKEEHYHLKFPAQTLSSQNEWIQNSVLDSKDFYDINHNKIRPVTDNHPFPYNLSIDQLSWKSFIDKWGKDETIKYLLVLVVFLLLLLILKFFGTERLISKKIKLFFFMTGFHQVLLQTYFIYKFLLFLSNPTYALMFIVGLALLAMSFCSWVINRGAFSLSWLRRVNVASVILSIAFFLQLEFNSHLWFLLDLHWRVVVLPILIFIVFCLSFFNFPFVLKEHHGIKKMYILDVMGCALASLIIPFAVDMAGIKSLFIGGMICFLVIIFIVNKLELSR